MAFHIAINDTKSEIWREYSEGIKFDRPYEVGLKSFVTYNNIFNITEKNNKLVFVYSDAVRRGVVTESDMSEEKVVDIKLLPENETADKKPETEKKKGSGRRRNPRSDGSEIPWYYLPYEGVGLEQYEEEQKNLNNKVDRVTVLIPPGIYEIEDIAAYVKKYVVTGEKFWIQLNKNTLKVEMGGTVTVDLSSNTSIGPLIGFGNKVYPRGAHYYSTGRVDIFPINMIRIKANIVKSNIDDTKRYDDTIYEFPLNVSPGEKIVERPNSVTFYTVNIDFLHELHLKIVDQDNNLIDFRGEKINIVLEFRPVSS